MIYTRADRIFHAMSSRPLISLSLASTLSMISALRRLLLSVQMLRCSLSCRSCKSSCSFFNASYFSSSSASCCSTLLACSALRSRNALCDSRFCALRFFSASDSRTASFEVLARLLSARKTSHERREGSGSRLQRRQIAVVRQNDGALACWRFGETCSWCPLGLAMARPIRALAHWLRVEDWDKWAGRNDQRLEAANARESSVPEPGLIRSTCWA